MQGHGGSGGLYVQESSSLCFPSLPSHRAAAKFTTSLLLYLESLTLFIVIYQAAQLNATYSICCFYTRPGRVSAQLDNLLNLLSFSRFIKVTRLATPPPGCGLTLLRDSS